MVILTVRNQANPIEDVGQRIHDIVECFAGLDGGITRCLVVLENFGAGVPTHFWERKRSGNELAEENEECQYHEYGHAEKYIIARLEHYLGRNNMPKNQAVDNMPKNQAVDNMPKNQAVDNMPKNQAVDNMPKNQAVDNMPKNQAVDNMPKNQAVDNMPKNPAVDNMPNNQAVDNMPKNQAVDNMPKNQAVDNMPKNQAVDNMPKNQAVDNMPKNQAVDNMPKNPAVDNMPKNQAVDNMPKNPAVDNMPNNQAVDNMPNNQAVDNMPNNQAVDNMPNIGGMRIDNNPRVTVYNNPRVTVYSNYSPCKTIGNAGRLPSCSRRLVTFLNAHENVQIEFRCIYPYIEHGIEDVVNLADRERILGFLQIFHAANDLGVLQERLNEMINHNNEGLTNENELRNIVANMRVTPTFTR